MRLRIVKIGRVAYPEIKKLAGMYEERLRPFARVEAVEVKDDVAALRLLKKPGSEHPVVILDERDEQWSSPDFAARLRRFGDDPGVKSLTFVVGGPSGLSQELRAQAKTQWSLSNATLASDIAWLLVWEQVYRAYNILKGTGYHHD